MSWPAMSIAEANARLTAPGSPFEIEEVEIRGVRMRSWKHAPRSTREVLTASRAFGDSAFLINDEERVNFEAFYRTVAVFATHLRARGLKKGDRVGIVARNIPEWAVVFFAATASGAIATPLNSWWSANELEFGVIDSGAKFVFIDGERFERLAPDVGKFPDLQEFYVSRSGTGLGERVFAFEEIVGTPDSWGALPEIPLPDVSVEPDDDATIFYTSGTTGRSRGAVGSHRNMLTNITGSAFSAARMFARRGEAMPVADADAPQQGSLLTVPLFHVTGSLAILVPSLYSGRKLVMMHHWDAEEAMLLIEKERITQITAVPTIAWQLLDHPARSKYDLSSLVGLGYGGASAAPELLRQLKKDFPEVSAGHGWGMTETSALATGHSAEDYACRPSSCGPSLPVGEIKIVSVDSLEECPVGETGELWFKGPQVVRGYWNQPAATSSTFVDGWVRTGDIARVDEEGFLYIVDRAKDMLIRGGENIYCVEVENVLYEHPAVMDAALVGRPHRTLGEEPVAFVTLKSGAVATAQEIRAFVANRLAAFKVPADIYLTRIPLARNANGKIIKTELKRAISGETMKS